MGADEDWMTSGAAAARLGVKPQTLYAYVSRGVVRSERLPGTRRSQFFRADVERLAAKRRSGGRAGSLEVIVETDLTFLDPGGYLYYRGWDVADAVADRTSFEEVASWLWGGNRSPATFEAPAAATGVALGATRALADQPLMDRLRAVVAAVRHADPLRDDRRPVAVAMTARSLIATLVEALPMLDGSAADTWAAPADRVDEAAGPNPAAVTGTSSDAAEPPSVGPSIAETLWPRLSPHPAAPDLVRLLDAALVLLADHELAASTLAARVAASTWADPYLVVQAGLAALGGPLHGGASRGARQLIRGVDAGTVSAAEAIGDRLRGGGRVPGFGHSVYQDRDPRAETLLSLLADIHPLRSETALIETMRERSLPFPNVDFAIASLAERHHMVDEAGEIVFAVARTAGWLAHAIEEYQHRLRFRPRAVYTGPPPLP